MNGENRLSEDDARELDARDSLAGFRDRLLLPEGVYLDGKLIFVILIASMWSYFPFLSNKNRLISDLNGNPDV